MRRYVVISGLPASGKSAVGRIIASDLALRFLDKDEFLESLFQSAAVLDLQTRQELSRRADASFRARAFEEPGAVLASWWRHPRSSGESGTPSDWLHLLPGSLFEVHCSCTPVVAAQRFMARKRHAGHLDGQRSYAELMEQFNEQAPLGPLGIGALIEVNTNLTIDAEAVLDRINLAFKISRSSDPAA